MVKNPNTPGVKILEISKFPPSVAQVETAIPAFIGYTEKAQNKEAADLLLKPKRITSLLEYERYFGTALNETSITVTESEGAFFGKITTPIKHNMYYAMQAFFANGGGPCYIVSVGVMSTPENIESDKLLDGLAEIKKVDEVTLIVYPESLTLSMANYQTLMDLTLAQCADLQDRFAVMDMPPPAAGETILQAGAAFRSSGVGTSNLKYGAVYGPNVDTVFNYLFADADVNVTYTMITETTDATTGEVTVTSTPGTVAALSTLDPTLDANTATANAAVYYAALRAIDDIPLELPPSSLVVGIYAAVDSSRGVWKAPANVSMVGVMEPTIPVSDEEQNGLNVHTSGKSINIIRSFAGKGTLIWGSRTLAGNDNEWRYVPVRRFFNMVEESVKKASEQFVFEPNDANTWARIRGMIENFLLVQWRNGALAGAKPEDAFFVKVGLPETMSALDILEGRMNVEIGMAAVRPAEFIILKFSHKMQVS